MRQVEALIVEAINSWERVVANDAFWQRKKEELRGKLGKKTAKSRKSAIRP